jgi:hypothetical protein
MNSPRDRNDGAGAVRCALRPTVRCTRDALAAALVSVASIASAGPFPAEIDLASLQPANGGNGSAGFVLNGIDRGDGAGYAVSNAGDIDHDGVDDFLIGTEQALFSGEAYLLFGRDYFPAELELSSLLAANGGNGSASVVVQGYAPGGTLGRSASALGDMNGDGIDDFVVGDPTAGGEDGEGQAYVVFGQDTSQGSLFPPELDVGTLLPANGGDGSRPNTTAENACVSPTTRSSMPSPFTSPQP